MHFKKKRLFVVLMTIAALFTALVSVTAAGEGFAGADIVNTLTDATATTSYNFSTVDAAVQGAVDYGEAGNYLLVVKDGEIVFDKGYGYEIKWTEDTGDVFVTHGKTPVTPEPVDSNTMWDLASVSKMLGTNLALMKLVYEGKLDVDAKVSDYIPEYHDYDEITALLIPAAAAKQNKDIVTVRMLLTHTAGQMPDPQYHNDYYLASERGREYLGFATIGVAKDYLYVPPQTPSTDADTILAQHQIALEAICKTPLANLPGTVVSYSDVDYMLLGLIIEKITGMPLDQYLETQIYQPLGLYNTMYNPTLKGKVASDFSATEINGNSRMGYRQRAWLGETIISNEFAFTGMRTYTLRGEVHDEKAYYVLGGVAGHAGLFSTPYEAAVLLQMVMNGGTYNGVTIFDKETVELFMEPNDIVLSTGYTRTDYALGWYVNDVYYPGSSTGWPSYFSNYASWETFGHQGWTGPVVFADPVNNIIVIYMRNKCHGDVSPTAPNTFTGFKSTPSPYLAVAEAIYRDAFGFTRFVSFLPNIDEYQGIVYNDFSVNPTYKVNVYFLDPVYNRPITRMYSTRYPRYWQVAIGGTAPAVPTENEPAGSTALSSPANWLAEGATYYFNATAPGDYYVSMRSGSNGTFNDAKIALYITIVDAAAPEVSYDITDPTNSDVVATITTGMEIVTPAGWTKVDATHYTKTFTANGDETVTLDYSASSLSLSDTIDVSVANIDKVAPVGSVSYSNTAPTNQPVTATITSDKDLQDISGWTKVNATTFTKEYSDSASETVTITDLLG
ncbi:MAG: serine hydrolase, partial [Erysipelotrichaceae bacterium]|nr:serine hydrolase [Erysipelotrichaceae bacterium]